MNVKKFLRKYLPQPSAHTASFFEKNHLAQQAMQKRNCMETLDYHLVEHCNLKCKCCSTFAPIAKEEFTDLEVFKSDLQQLRSIIGDRLLNLHLLGGEPLLHPEIEQFVIAARSIFPECYIDIVTNGLLARKMPDSFWNTLREQNVILQFSYYPINLNYQELMDYVKAKGATPFIRSYDQKIVSFKRKGLEPFGQQLMNGSYLHCSFGSTTQLRKGKLYHCPTTAYIFHLNRKLKEEDPSRPEETFKLHPLDTLDIYQVQSAEEIYEYLSRAIPFCRYCRCNGTTEVTWEQSKKDVEEWVDFS